jgi:hypothetical protein
MRESFSFHAKFPNGGAVASLHIDKFVTNGRPIICLGSLNGDIAVYYLDSDPRYPDKLPQLLKQFNFLDRGAKFDPSSDSDEEAAKPAQDDRAKNKVSISFKNVN